MRAAVYARYSSDLQSDASIEDQIRLCKERIAREGWWFLTAYTDRARSGASTLRAGYQALLEDARLESFDIVVVEALDRLSRDQEDVAGLFKRLRFHGIRIVTLAEGEISELHVGLKGTMNALFLKDLAAKTHRGLRGRVEQGRSGGGLCYGYDVMREIGPNGDPIYGARTINFAEAAIVCRVFRDFTAGKSPRRIAFELNAEGVAGPRGISWGASTINGNVARGTGILNNELYVGRLVWNRLRYIKDPATGKRVSRLNPAKDWIVREVPELRIVPQELWDRVKGRQKALHRDTRPDAKGERPFWDRRRPRYLFSGLMRCGVCGGAYTKVSTNLFGCATARNKGTCDNRLNIRTDGLEATVLDGLRTSLMDPARFKLFAEAFVQEVNQLRMADSARQAQFHSEIARIDRRLRKLVDAIADGTPIKTLKDEMVALEARQDELRVELAQAASPQPLLHPNLAEIYRQEVALLHEALADPSSKDEAMDQIRRLVEAIILTPENGALRIDLKGELAGILAMAQKKTAAGEVASGRLAEQIKMVAGRGFEPLTFRL